MRTPVSIASLLMLATACGAPNDAAPTDDLVDETPVYEEVASDDIDTPDDSTTVDPIAEPATTTSTEPPTTPVESPTHTPIEPPAEDDPDCLEVLFPPFPDLLAAELYEHVQVADLPAAVDTMLSSPGDSTKLKLGGDLKIPIPNPIIPGLTVGRKVDLDAQLSVVAAEAGSGVAFELAISAEQARKAGLAYGVASVDAGVSGASMVVWRFDTRAELVEAVGHVAAKTVLRPTLVSAVATLSTESVRIVGELGELQQEITDRLAGRTIDFIERFFPRVAAWLEEARQKESKLEARLVDVTRALELLDALSHWAQSTDEAFRDHFSHFEVQRTTGVHAALGGGLKWLELKLSGDVERSFAVEIAAPEPTVGTRVGVSLQLANTAKLGAKLVVPGIEAEIGRTITVAGEGVITSDGVEIDWLGSEATLAIDRAFTGELNAGVTGKYGVGRKASLTVAADDLLVHGALGIAQLVNGSPDEAAAIIQDLPVACSGQARFTRGVSFEGGLPIQLASLTAKVEVGGVWTDSGDEVTAENLPTPESVRLLLTGGAVDEIAEDTFEMLTAVGAEVAQLSP